MLTYIATLNGLFLVSDGYGYLSLARLTKLFLNDISSNTIDKDLLGILMGLYGGALKHWPPLYSMVLSTIGWFNDPYVAARYLHLFFPVLIGLLTFMIFRQHRKSYKRIFFATALILLAPFILVFNWFPISEFLFFILQLLVMLIFSKYLYSQKTVHLLLTAFFIGLACLTRYIGIAMIPAIVVTTLYLNSRYLFKTSFLTILFCVLLCLIPVALFVLFPFSGNDFSLSSRNYFVWAPPDLFIFFWITIQSLLLCLSPAWFPFYVKILCSSFTAVIFFVAIRSQLQDQTHYPPPPAVIQFQYFIGACICFYVLTVLCFSFFCIDKFFLGLNSRYLAPILVWLIFLFGMMGPDESNRTDNLSKNKKFMYIGLLVIIFIYTWSSSVLAVKTNNKNILITKRLKQDPVWSFIKHSPNIKCIISNEAGKAFHYSGIPAFALPNQYIFETSKDKKKSFLEYMHRLKQILNKYNGIVIYFNPYLNEQPEIAIMSGTVSVEECLTLLDLQIKMQTENCQILIPEP